MGKIKRGKKKKRPSVEKKCVSKPAGNVTPSIDNFFVEMKSGLDEKMLRWKGKGDCPICKIINGDSETKSRCWWCERIANTEKAVELWKERAHDWEYEYNRAQDHRASLEGRIIDHFLPAKKSEEKRS